MLILYSFLHHQDYPCVVVVGLGKKDVESNAETSEECERIDNLRQASGGEISLIINLLNLFLVPIILISYSPLVLKEIAVDITFCGEAPLNKKKKKEKKKEGNCIFC